jgi:hypothetical protein
MIDILKNIISDYGIYGILIVGCFIMIRYLLKLHQEFIAYLKEQNTKQGRIIEEYTKQQKLTTKIASLLSKNIKELTEILSGKK